MVSPQGSTLSSYHHGLIPGPQPKVPDPGSHPSVSVPLFRMPVSLNKIRNEFLIRTPCMYIEIKRELDSLEKKVNRARKTLLDIHQFNLHTGREQIFCLIRSFYWIPSFRGLIRTVLRECFYCIQYTVKAKTA